MAYVPGFSSDVFVSYSHNDDEPFGLPFGEKFHWVTEFHRKLEIRIKAYLGRPVTIWRDPRLTGADVFSNEIVEQLRHSAILLSVVSPSYIGSDWCKRELDTFIGGARDSGGLSVRNKNRIVKVLKMPVGRELLPEVLDSVLGYCFYSPEDDLDAAREFLLDPGPEGQRRYWSKLDEVARGIKSLFDAMKRNNGAAAARAENQQAVYLGAATSDCQPEHDLIRRELEDRGYTILPDRPFPWSAEQLIESIRADLARCVMSIHLLGTRYGVIPEGERRSIAQLQADLAAERGGLSRVIWIRPGLEPKDDSQRMLLEKARTVYHDAGPLELLETPIEEVKTFVLDRLKKQAESTARPAAPVAPAQAAVADGGGRIYLICDERDRPAVLPLRKDLMGRGFEVTLPLLRGNPDEIRQDHQENLLLCDGVIIYWGVADEAWLRSKMRDLLRAPGLGRTAPFKAKNIVIADPPNDDKELFASRDFAVVKVGAQFSPDSLSSFVGQLGQ